MNDILEKVNHVFNRVLDNDQIVLTPRTTANDVEEWDSLAHIQLIVAIEKEFHIKFTTLEITKWKNIGDVCRLINEKINS